MADDNYDSVKVPELPEPVSEAARSLRDRVSPRIWKQKVASALQNAAIFEAIEASHAAGLAKPKSAVEHGWSWSRFGHMRRRAERRAPETPLWEALLDTRVPPVPTRIGDDVRDLAVALRKVNPEIGVDRALAELIERFGDRGNISPPSLRRIWAAGGVSRKGGGASSTAAESSDAQPGLQDDEEREVQHYHGGGGLALLGAADTELGITKAMAEAAVAEAERQAEEQEAPPVFESATGPRDDGRFAEGYNEKYRETTEDGEADPRWDTDTTKRQRRVLETVQLLLRGPKPLAQRLLVLALTPFVTERRGFDGLNGPSGEWMEAAGVYPYKTATLQKALSELALFGLDEVLWDVHGAKWHTITANWREGEDAPAWLACAVYVDATQDPYWTRHFALSSKVSRTNKVQPCLSRVALASGPGVPIVIDVFAGHAAAGQHVLRLLDKMDELVGPDMVGRFTIVDSEMSSHALLDHFEEFTDRSIVTVVKGARLKSALVDPVGQWQSYRDRDEIREVEIYLKRGKENSRKPLRGVEMRRTGSRMDKPIVYITTMDNEALSTAEVVDAYLSRWPNQEHFFRNMRNGGGMNRSHGFGGEYVDHVALDTQLEKAARRVGAIEEQLDQLKLQQAVLADAKPNAPDDDYKAVSKTLAQQVRKLEKKLATAQEYLNSKTHHPAEIYKRDTTRESIMTALKTTGALLTEHVLRAYFGGRRMTLRTFIETLIPLPVATITTKTSVEYVFRENKRQPKEMDMLREACEQMNSREIHRGNQRLSFSVTSPKKWSQIQ